MRDRNQQRNEILKEWAFNIVWKDKNSVTSQIEVIDNVLTKRLAEIQKYFIIESHTHIW